MNIRNFVGVIFIIFLGVPNVFAQKLYVQGGVNANTMHISGINNIYDSQDINPRIGLNAALLADFPLIEGLYFETGLMFTSKGFRYDLSDWFGEGVMIVRLNYFDVPFTLKKVIPLNEEIAVYGLAGPYVGFGLFGQAIFKFEGSSDSQTVRWGNGQADQYKRLNTGLKFGLGAELDLFSVQLDYNLGLTDVRTNPENYSEKHRYLQLSVLLPI